MRFRILAGALLLVAVAYGREPKRFETGVLLRMDSVECGFDENSGQSLTGSLIGTDSAHRKTHALLCQEYVLQSARLIYRIRPKEEKHPILLPVGEKAQFRMHKDKLMLKVEDGDDKEREYIVVSMTPREEVRSAGTTSNGPHPH
jgi:hypothetical protein